MMRHRYITFICFMAASILFIWENSVSAETPYPIEWIRQFGTDSYDESKGVAVDHLGNVFVTGETFGSLGKANAGKWDAFLTKYDTDGNMIWMEQLGTPESDCSNSVAADSDGNVYISGYTFGELDVNYTGSRDGFLSKYNTATGGLIWTKQYGTTKWIDSKSIAVDELGNTFIVGQTPIDAYGNEADEVNIFAIKYDSSGSQLWLESLGTPSSDVAFAVAPDNNGNMLITGYTAGMFGDMQFGYADAFVAKVDTAGNLLWSSQLGTPMSDFAFSVVSDQAGNTYIAGDTNGNLGSTGQGDFDAFIAKYDIEGNLVWTEQFGTSEYDKITSIAVDPSGSIFVSGVTEGSLGKEIIGYADIFLAKYTPDGNRLWLEQLGDNRIEENATIAIDRSGNVFLTGQTGGSLGAINVGEEDVFLVKFTAPEPGTIVVLGFGGLLLLRMRF